VLGERWALLIVRDMLNGFTRYNDLARCNPGLSRTLLSRRLRQLDPDLLVWSMHRRLDFSLFGERRVVLAFAFRDRRERYWIVRGPRGPRIFTYDPGFGVDATVIGELAALHQVWVGRRPGRGAGGRHRTARLRDDGASPAEGARAERGGPGGRPLRRPPLRPNAAGAAARPRSCNERMLGDRLRCTDRPTTMRERRAERRRARRAAGQTSAASAASTSLWNRLCT
jgi:hypothetical protein